MIGELLAATCDDPSVLARIGGPFGVAAREAAGGLATLPDPRAYKVRLIAALRAPVPPGLRGVHPTWIEAGLAGLPGRVRDALAAGPREAVDVWLVRWACAELPPLPPSDPSIGVPTTLAMAIRLPADRLAAWLAGVGADQLAFALRSKPDALQAIASTLGRDGDLVVAAVRRIGTPPRAGALGETRDAIARCRGGNADLLVRIGARALAPRTDPLARRQLAVRLPRPLGLAIAGELEAHARDPIDRAPTWAALGAG